MSNVEVLESESHTPRTVLASWAQALRGFWSTQEGVHLAAPRGSGHRVRLGSQEPLMTHPLCVAGHPSCPLDLPPKVLLLPLPGGHSSHLSRLSRFRLVVTSYSTSFRRKISFSFPCYPPGTLPLGVVAVSPKHRFLGPYSQRRDNGPIAFLP